MKLNKLVMALGISASVFTAVMPSIANAADTDDTGGSSSSTTTTATTDSTTVNFHGTITETPCSLDSGSDNQTVELGHISAYKLENEGSSTPKNFSFKLTDCSVVNQKTVSVTFGGTADANNTALLALGSGDASGAGIAIEANGSDVTLGKATAAQTLSEGDNVLTFAAYLKGDGATTITPGEFTSVSNVTFTYQ